MKILLSGGHLTPALALCDYIQALHSDDSLVFAGRRYSQDSTKQLAHEYQEIKNRGLTFVEFWAPRWQAGFGLWIVLFPLQFVWSWMKAIYIFLRHRPTVYMSFGGYLAVPLALAAWLLRIPIVTHEQTRVIGTATQFISKLATKVAVSFADTSGELPSDKVVITGNPLRPVLFTPKPNRPTWLPSSTRKPILYVTGGNQGSQVINTLIEQALPTLTKSWLVIHQCGNKSATTNYRKQLERSKAKLPAGQQGAYFVSEWFSELDLAWIYQNAQVVVARAGANTLAELITFELPSVVIPLPFSHGNEQQRNAEWLAGVGGTYVIPQKQVNATELISALHYVKNHRANYLASLAQVPKTKDAAKALYQVITKASR